MIVEFIIQVFYTVFRLVLSPISLPSLPGAITTLFDFILTHVTSAMALLTYIYSAPLLAAFIVVAVAIFAFDQLYFITIWLLRKLPIGVK